MSVDWLLLSRYALLVALCELIPVPLLDGYVASRLRRRLTRIQLKRHRVELPNAEVAMLADATAGGCLGMLWSLIVWPFQRLLRILLFVLLINRIVNTFSEVVHRALLVHEALEMKVVPGDVVAVRAAMNRAATEVDTGVADKALFDVLHRSRRELWRLFRSLLPRTRAEAEEERHDAPVREGGELPLTDKGEALSRALADAVRVPGVQAELLHTFRRELAEPG